jgi:hypothetical protein
MNRILLVVAFFLFSLGQATAQNCSQTLRLARSTYDQGRLHELPELMKKCLANTGTDGFTKQERVEAYKLLTMAFIYLEEPEKADSSMLLLLHTDPYFELNENVDPAEFIGLYKTFRTRPVFRIGVKFGVNASQPNVLNYNAISDGTAKYSYKLGVSIGVAAEIPFTNKLTITPELHYVNRSFAGSYERKNLTLPSETSTTTSSGQESQGWISLPILVQYQFAKRKLLPFVSAGGTFDYLISSSLSGEKRQTDAQSIEIKSFDTSIQREKINIGIVLGAGLKYPIAKGYLIGEFRYTYGLTKINSSSTLLQNQQLLFDYNYVDGIFKLNSLSLSVGYVQNFFNPKKKKRK